LPVNSFGQIEFTSSPNPVGSGARALGMGGSFIAIADDATAASWNPAGLVQLESPELSIVGAYFNHIEDNSFSDHPEANKEQNVSGSNLNYLSVSYPFQILNRNMIVSLNYQHLFDFSREWNFPFQLNQGSLSVDSYVDYTQDGQLYAIGAAYAVQLLPNFSIGITFNLWEDFIFENNWEQKSVIEGKGTRGGTIPVSLNSVDNDKYDFSGFNANIGIHWQVNNQITLGGVLKTPFSADLRHKSSLNTTLTNDNTSEIITETDQSSDDNEALDMPLSYGFGIAYRFSDSFTTSLDLYRTEWDDFVHTDSNGNKTSFVSGKPVSESDIDPTTQIRFGSEYLLIKPTYVVPFRFGLFYDPAPQEGSPDEYCGATLGSGYGRGRLIFDMAYQYRWGENVGKSLVRAFDFSQDVREHTVYISLIIHF